MMSSDWILAAVVGLAAGLHCATWGMYKDGPFEGFSWRTYMRSPVLATGIALALAALFPGEFRGAAGATVLFGVTYGLERAFSEIYKTFIREQDQSKYTIPMQFAVFGRVVKSRAVRLAVGAGYLAVGLAVLYGTHRLQMADTGMPRVLEIFLVSSAGGWISAFGGAWKDAPIEGFHTFKFFRSPAFAFGYGALLSMLTPRYPFLFLGAIGYTVATIETYKTFFFPNKKRGKFQGKEPVFQDFLRTRNRFVPLYVAITLVVLVTAGVALSTAQGTTSQGVAF